VGEWSTLEDSIKMAKAAKKRNGMTPYSAGARFGPVRRVVLALSLVASLTLIVAFVAWRSWGSTAALVVVGFTTALLSLAKALIELHGKLEGQQKSAVERRPRTSLWVTVVASLMLGIVTGYFAVPRLIRLSVRPTISIGVPRLVSMRQQVELRWRNLPPDSRPWLLVYSPQERIYFPQRCPTIGSTGEITCELEIGGTRDSDKEFQIQAIVADRSGCQELEQWLKEPGFFSGLPSCASLLESVTVRRRP